MKLTSKLPALGLTIFSEMTQLANDFRAINLSQGFPDFEVHPELTGLVAHYMQEGCNQYAPMLGVALLRERIAAKVLELYSACYDPASEITLTSGATEVLFAAITAVVGRNDDISLMTDNRDMRFRIWDGGLQRTTFGLNSCRRQSSRFWIGLVFAA